MAIGLGYINVVLRKEAYEGLDARKRFIVRQAFSWRPAWFRFDDHLLATTFMAPRDVRTFCEWLTGRTGLQPGGDFAVVDVVDGACLPAPWLDFDSTSFGAGLAWLKGQSSSPVDPVCELTPAGANQLTSAFRRDSVDDPHGPDGRPTRDAATPAWGGTSLWFYVKPGHSTRGDLDESRNLATMNLEGFRELLDGLVKGV